MLWINKRIFVSNIKFIVINIVQKHIDTAKVICSYIDFLTVKNLDEQRLCQGL